MIHMILRLASITVAAVLSAGCAPRSALTPARTLESIAGEWALDLSPKQDGSDIKKLEIVPDKRFPNTFGGVVYNDTKFDNGLALETRPNTFFSFVSDENGENGGPYYWLGITQDQQLTGTVQSLSRKFQQRWIARRPKS